MFWTCEVLGLNISSDLKWNIHVGEIVRKVSTRLYFLRQLKRANVPIKELLLFYVTCLRPITEYACQVFHNGLPQYLVDDLERLQEGPTDHLSIFNLPRSVDRQ